MRYYIKCKLKSDDRRRLAYSLHSGTLARNKIFYEGMQTALREGTIDENGIVHFIEVCYCLEGGLYPMAMEIPVLKEYFEDVVEVKDACLRDNVRWNVNSVIVLEISDYLGNQLLLNCILIKRMRRKEN